MRCRLRTLLLLAVTATTYLSSSWGQPPSPRQEIDLAVTYVAQGSNLTPGQSFWRQGGSLELSTESYHGLGIAANFAGSEANNIVGSGIDLNTFTSTFGPRYTWHRRSGRVSLFGQGLIGESHGWNSIFPQATGATSEFNTFALQVGGGADLRISRHFAIRALQADWIRTEFPNATTNVQNTLRLGAGVVLRLPH
jgi:hypothetical protein